MAASDPPCEEAIIAMQNIVVGRYGENEGLIEPVNQAAAALLERMSREEWPWPEHGELSIGGQVVARVRRRWKGWLEPDDRGWIMFVDDEDRPYVYLSRDPASGAVSLGASVE